jgi:hypothetical protein
LRESFQEVSEKNIPEDTGMVEEEILGMVLDLVSDMHIDQDKEIDLFTEEREIITIEAQELSTRKAIEKAETIIIKERDMNKEEILIDVTGAIEITKKAEDINYLKKGSTSLNAWIIAGI